MTSPPKPTRLERRAANRAAWAARATDPEAWDRRRSDRQARIAEAQRRLPELQAVAAERRKARRLVHRHEQLRRDHRETILALWRGAAGASAVLLVDADDELGRTVCDPGAAGVVVGTLPLEVVPDRLARLGVHDRAARAAAVPLRAGELRIVVAAGGAVTISTERAG